MSCFPCLTCLQSQNQVEYLDCDQELIKDRKFAVAGRRVHYCSTKTTTKSLSVNNQKAAVFSANGVMTWRVGAGVEQEYN